jgi:septal ring factor EnvC (AmiA/AmiB activator)
MAWLLVAAALACAAGWGLAQHRSVQLQRELSATQSELGEARAKLAVLEAQRSEVHSQLQALSAEATALAGRLVELEALASSDHTGAADVQVMRSESASGE